MFYLKRFNRFTTLIILATLCVLLAHAADVKSNPSSAITKVPVSNLEYGIDYDNGDDNYDEEDEDDDDDDDDDDCDNGDDSDDGSRWHAQEKKGVSEKKSPTKPLLLKAAQAHVPFPKWLIDLTGLHAWPGAYPPYIPQAHIDLEDLPEVPLRGLGNCAGIEPWHCSFDCTHCIAPDDIVTCHELTQTFDDGPGPATVRLLDALPGKTTFFTQGINVVRFPETFRLQNERGHLLASHTWSHGNLAGLTNEEVAAQIQWSIWAMNATAGIVPRYFRPPYGAIDDRVRAITRQFGLVNVIWNRDTFDWMVTDRQKTVEEVMNDVDAWLAERDPVTGEAQGIMLEHDSTEELVNIGIEVAKLLGPQMTVAECINAAWYQ